MRRFLYRLRESVCVDVHVYRGTKYLVPENLINTLNSSGSSGGNHLVVRLARI